MIIFRRQIKTIRRRTQIIQMDENEQARIAPGLFMVSSQAKRPTSRRARSRTDRASDPQPHTGGDRG